MAQATNVSIISPSRFHNLANPALADALGHADAVLRGAEAECRVLKDEFKRGASSRPLAVNSLSQPPSKSQDASIPRP